MNVQRLRCFLAVAQELHFGRAAETLRLSPSPLSKQIKLLERELGGALFVRGYHEVTPTARATALVEPVREILRQIDALPGIAAQAAGEARLHVGIAVYAPNRYVRRFVTALRDLPETAIITSFGHSVDLCREVQSGTLDAALIHFPPPDSSFANEVLWTYETGLAMRADDPLANHERIQQTDLVGREVANMSGIHPELSRQRLAWLADAGVARVVDVPTGLIEKAKMIHGLGVVATVLDTGDTQSARVLEPDIVIRPFADPVLDMALGLIWSEANALKNRGLVTMLEHALRLKTDMAEAGADPAALDPAVQRAEHDGPTVLTNVTALPVKLARHSC